MEFHFVMYTISAYVIAYFFLSIFITLILVTGNTSQSLCKLGIVEWYLVSAVFYFGSFIITGSILFLIRRIPLLEKVVIIRSFVLIFKSYPKNWLYLYLICLEFLHLGLTTWGSFINFTDFSDMVDCYTELTLLSSFMFILIILGYIYILRLFCTTLHFWLGFSIYTWLKRNIRCLRKNELHLK